MIRVLQRNGVRVVLPRQSCSGTPVETYGHRELARTHARYNLSSLGRFDRVITSCASCTLMLKDYPKFFQGEERRKASELAGRVTHITQFLLNELELKLPVRKGPERVVTYHSSCHLRAAGVTKEPRELLRRLPGTRYAEMGDSDRCAGGAGTYIVKDWALSQQIFERKRRGIVESGAQVVATSCPACMIQLDNGLQGRIPVKHIVQLIDELYDQATV